jgi:hypothetical protein
MQWNTSTVTVFLITAVFTTLVLLLLLTQPVAGDALYYVSYGI